jgi:hypothetical protein
MAIFISFCDATAVSLCMTHYGRDINISYANFLNAEILVIAGRYSNRMETLLKNTKESWVDDISPYLAALTNVRVCNLS